MKKIVLLVFLASFASCALFKQNKFEDNNQSELQKNLDATIAPEELKKTYSSDEVEDLTANEQDLKEDSYKGDVVENNPLYGEGYEGGAGTREQEAQTLRNEALIKYHRDMDNSDLVKDLRAKSIDARVDKRGVIINLEDASFLFNSAKLTTQAKMLIGEVSVFLKKVDDRDISVEGHTDSVGTVVYNQQLSLGRATNVANELVNNGISRSRISIKGYGESDPVATNRTEEGRIKNRRVEIIIK